VRPVRPASIVVMTIAIVGAYGHTGRFAVADLLARGHRPLLLGRDPARLAELARQHGGLPTRQLPPEPRRAGTRAADAGWGRALDGADSVLNCAGPFADTVRPVLSAALAAGVPDVDVAAEVEAVADTFADFAEPALAAGVPVVPAMAFYGGLGDLLVTATGDGAAARVDLAYALSSWRPTAGTRAATAVSARRRSGRRIVYAGGRLTLVEGAAPRASWTFPPPVGEQPVLAEFTTADSVTIPRHLAVPELATYMTLAPLADLADGVPPPEPADGSGRSAQTFLVEAVVHRAGGHTRAVARGRDIYAISATMAVEAALRIGTVKPGVHPPGAAFGTDLLGAVPGLSVDLP
jgi:hypothetical protein